MMLTRRTALAALCALCAPVGARRALAAEPLTIALLKYGTVAWEIETILRERLAAAEGVELVMRGVASGAAARIAFEGGGADLIVSDWIWVARQRAMGRDYVFAPYSRAVGALIVPPESTAQSLADLRGGRIGVAGGPLDKSWLILQARARQEGVDLARDAEPVFGAPPLIQRMGLTGELDAVLTYWHFEARLRANGFRRLVRVAEAARALGLPKEIPLLGYVFRESLLQERPEAVRGFLAASGAAKALLLESDAAWEPLRARMKPANEAEFEALREGFRAGVPTGPVDPEGAAALFARLAELGGAKLAGSARTLPDGVFYGGG